MQEINKGSIVMSTAGRDSGKLFFVIDVKEKYALIVDGELRRTEKPKQKNLKHLKFYSENTNERIYRKIISGVKLENAEVRKALKLFLSEEVF